jgi:hypothetical protein
MGSTPRKVRTAIVGLGFGAEFIPIHQRHPHAELVAICQRSRDKLDELGKAHGVERRYESYANLLKDKEIDAVHINSPIPDHAAMSIAALEAGKHVMCTVPMATSVDDCKKIVELSAKTGLKDSDVVARVIRSLFDTARQYRESFDVYGSKQSFEWQLCEGEEPVLHTAKKPEPEIPAHVTVPDFAHLLPEPIRCFTTGGVYDADEHQHLSFTQGGGHGGSHPHLVHEFVTALVEGRDPYPNARQSANWTCTGLLAHESAMHAGAIRKLPEWTLS